ncbi:putative glutamate receptor [Vespula squamosa]|uniref:Glutamate receptor n=1 Tax=Vespula squamosa TaxID=30214 RepID=A0ABD1ZWB0_VESSQ
MRFLVRLAILVPLFFLFLSKIVTSYEYFPIGDEHVPFIINICKLYGTKSTIFLYSESAKEMEMKTIIFKWTRALSREGFTSTNLYFSQLHKLSYYVERIVRPHYIALISNYNAINELSLATSTFDMSNGVWLVFFIYKGHGSNYCHSPPGNIFHLRFDSEMLVRCGTENILREWYSIDSNRTEIDDVATWSLEKGIINIAPKSLYERRHNLQGLVMRGVIVKDSLVININEDNELDGIFGRILAELCVTLNFSLNIVSEVDEYGSWNSKGKIWSGAVGELYTGRADISISDFSITSTRLNAVDFTLPLLLSKKCLFIREPQIFAIKWSSFFLAFSHSIWIAILVIIIVGSILLVFLKKRNGTDRNVGHLLSDNFLEIWGIFCQQGLADFPDRFPLRIAYFSMILLAVILSAAYSGALISFLTSGTTVLPFRSLEDFLEDGTYELSVFRGTSDYDMFAYSKHPFEKKLMKLMMDEEKLTSNVLDGFERVCDNGKLALYTSEDVQKIINLKITCNLASIDTGRVDSLAMILSKNNPFTDVINFHLQKFINNGMINRLKDTTFKKKLNDAMEHKPVGISNVMSLIFFIQTGIILSTFILIIEKCIFSSKMKKMLIVDRTPSIKSSGVYVKKKKSIKDVAKDHEKRKRQPRSNELISVDEGYVPLIIEVCKLYKTKSIIFLFAESITEMKMTTAVFKWTRALSPEGFTTSNLYFSELCESSYYVERIVRPHYVVVISDYNAINEFSIATSTFDMSFAAWLVIFIYKEKHGFDYCHTPPGNIFHLKFNTEMWVRCGTENILREWYSIDSNRTEIDDVATWRIEKGITRIIPDTLHDRRYNLQGLIMRAVIVKNSPFVRLKDNKLDGMFGRILKELCMTLNFSLNIVSEVEEYGIWNPKEKTWSGAVGELYAGRADISISDFSITSARLNAVDFTLPLLLSKNYIYIQKPEIFAIKWSSYFLAFSNSVWIAIFGISVCATILLIFFKIKYGSDSKIGYLLADSFLDIWGIFCQQGLASFPERSSFRIAYFSMILLAAILSAAYSAALISFLASATTVLPFRSLEGFVADGSYKLVVVRGSADYDLFANSEHTLAKKLMNLMLEHEKLPLTVLEGFRRICKNPKLAIYAPDEVERSESVKIPCKLINVETGKVDSLAMILSKNNPFTDVINFHLQKFINNGMIDRLTDRTFKDESDDEINHQPVRITSIISLIFFILIGTVLSTCILIIEKCFFVHKNKKEVMLDLISLKKSSVYYIKRNKNIKNIVKYQTNRKCKDFVRSNGILPFSLNYYLWYISFCNIRKNQKLLLYTNDDL